MSNRFCLFYDRYKKIIINYIISTSLNGIKSFDFNNWKLYKEYTTKGKNYCFIIFEEGEKMNLMSEGNVYIEKFDFESGKVNNFIQINNENLYIICTWNKNFIIINGEDCIFI